ncbi:MAG: YciI family protein [Actinomycetota bacterium]
MIVVELAFTPSDARLAARPAHRTRLEALHADGTLLAAGPWADDHGALLVFAAARTVVDRVLTEDPYYSTDGVDVVSIEAWSPIVGP